MIIPIDDEWRLSTDEYQWRVEKYAGIRKAEDGTEVPRWNAVMYFPTFKVAVEGLTQRLVRELPSVGVEEAIKDIDNLIKRLGTALPEVKIELRS